MHEALLRLIREREYHRISVGEILARANVGRSTFYTHFRDKEALFASAVQEMLASLRPATEADAVQPTERIIGFARPLFEHIERHRSAGGARMGQRGRVALHEHVRRILARWVGEEMRRDASTDRNSTARFPPDLLAQYVASTFVLVLDWWVDRRCMPSATEADALFRSLVLPVVGPSSMAEGAGSCRSAIPASSPA
ncbi:MAG TPA: TetR/AcrR family transcriptional regulator [Steroidobacteraceae bacterium]|nr:TetR/AcrR family transcriptional regulator [Steroidobacteraceae bacterium]